MENNNDKAPSAAKPTTHEAQAPQPQVQYIVTEQSLEGLGGWLIFWMVVFAIAGLGYIVAFFAIFETADYANVATTVTNAIFFPLLAVGYITSVVLMALRKKLARLVSIITLGVAGVASSVTVIVQSSTSYFAPSIAATVGLVLTALVGSGLIILYFVLSKRVQKTLTR